MLAKNLKRARRNKEYSQEQVATKLRITQQALSKWENGHAYPDVITLKLLCDLYQVSIDEMLKNDEILEMKQKEIGLKEEDIEPSKKEHVKNDEFLFIIVVTITSCLIPFLGVAVSLLVFIRAIKGQKKYSLSIKLIVFLCLILSLVNSFIILNNIYFHIGEATIS